jgi:hypothetical protein
MQPAALRLARQERPIAWHRWERAYYKQLKQQERQLALLSGGSSDAWYYSVRCFVVCVIGRGLATTAAVGPLLHACHQHGLRAPPAAAPALEQRAAAASLRLL